MFPLIFLKVYGLQSLLEQLSITGLLDANKRTQPQLIKGEMEII